MTDELLFFPSRLDLNEPGEANAMLDVVKAYRFEGLEVHDSRGLQLHREWVTLLLYRKVLAQPHRIVLVADTEQQMNKFVEILRVYMRPAGFETVPDRTLDFKRKPYARPHSYSPKTRFTPEELEQIAARYHGATKPKK